MKKILTALLLGGTLAMNAAQKIDRIEPTNWYVGMKNPSVQLMVYGKDIRSAEVSTNYPGVKIDSLVRLDSPNYLLVYMNIKDAQPGTMKLCFKTGKNKTNVNSLVGQEVLVVKKISPFQKGEVKAKNGVIWTAQNADPQSSSEIPEGTVCTIEKIDGNTLSVKPLS